ncbi:Pseudouridine-5'-phosphate glycosidase [Penicillium subrubescens]|uniref:Pseudouridine-metabolizing bifunctional protein n=1 Tax=Penicillium subrubescens TaxID=1316194 RepID=A0A1Q5UR06_9EURO|nr:Pseudouridine-5'-phosphate glycosidase [Penicillium subrubescens]KAJ5896071.1 Pseudouridine-5'-phosphate glycosidase [Penicillium subrubescens]OKP14902.1 Pseudouridine-metabolizing bifunctional protein [Penicillium subrubescens]
MLASRTATRFRCWRGARLPRARHLHDLHKHPQSRFLQVSEEVRDAVATGKPVVALETTIYTHGFPYPENIALAQLLETVVRDNGGVPATIGILGGVARVGMTAEEMVELASTAEQKSALKVSRRDLGYICGLGLAGKKIHGGTTISGTMILSELAGIKIFGTGGLGGVHRGGENSMDISADLTELGRTPVTVISSGCKSFLDIPRTLEYLETEGVCVGTFADGREGSVDFPAFFTRDSGIRSPRVIQDEAEAAAIVYAQSKLPIHSGIHFANPVPREHSVPKPEMDRIIEEAVRLADVEGYKGSDNTPFVLGKIKELSGGKSVIANRALVESNVKRATRVAVELAKLEDLDRGSAARHMPAIPSIVRSDTAKDTPKPSNSPPKQEASPQLPEKADVLVAGSLAIDLSCDYTTFGSELAQVAPVPHTSNPAVIGQSLGGVGHNVAVAASYVGSDVLFCSVVADDLSGRAALASLTKEGLNNSGIQVLPASSGTRTAQYVAINDAKKDLLVAMADMGIVELPEYQLSFDGFWEPLIERTKPRWVVVDANWRPEVIARWTAIARKHGARVAFEPVSTAKSRRLFGRDDSGAPAAIGPAQTVPNNAISLACPNKLELSTMYMAAREEMLFESSGWWSIIDAMGLSPTGSRERLVMATSAKLVDEGLPQQSIQLLPFIPCIITKLGAAGALLTQLLPPNDPRLTDPDSAPYILSRASSAEVAFGGVYMRLFPPAATLKPEEVVSVNGAGDTLLGVMVAGLAKSASPARVEDLLPLAQEASRRTLMSAGGVSKDLTGLQAKLGSIA